MSHTFSYNLKIANDPSSDNYYLNIFTSDITIVNISGQNYYGYKITGASGSIPALPGALTANVTGIYNPNNPINTSYNGVYYDQTGAFNYDNFIFVNNTQGSVQGSIYGIDYFGIALKTNKGDFNLNKPYNSNSLSVTRQGYSDRVDVISATYTQTPCYCPGTSILTHRGEVAVEDLAVGEHVLTASGEHRPIRWIGHRTLDIAKHPDPASVWPVRVAAGALGDKMPQRDLWVSPRHALFVDGVLIPAIRLVNGRTVMQVETETVSYWHVELDSHDILLAEGLPAESYIDCGNRAGFANGGGVMELHPDFAPKTVGDMCAPLMENGREVAAAKRRLLARAEVSGFGTTQDAGLHILADGVAIEPEPLEGHRFAFDLPTDAKDIRLVSRTWCPAHLDPDSGDRRDLGILVTRLERDGRVHPLGTLSEGWHPIEGKPESPCRWTTGSAALPLGARRIVVRIGGSPRYWAEAAPVTPSTAAASPLRAA